MKLLYILALGAAMGAMVGVAVVGALTALTFVLAFLTFWVGSDLLALGLFLILAFTFGGIMFAYLEIYEK